MDSLHVWKCGLELLSSLAVRFRGSARCRGMSVCAGAMPAEHWTGFANGSCCDGKDGSTRLPDIIGYREFEEMVAVAHLLLERLAREQAFGSGSYASIVREKTWGPKRKGSRRMGSLWAVSRLAGFDEIQQKAATNAP